MICGQTFDEPWYSKVPLSWVPPIRLPVGFFGLADRLWNCRVERPLFRTVVSLGIRFSSDWQYARAAPVSPRAAQALEPSTYVPLERTTPPSSPSKNCSGLPGTVTIACWSGWIQPAPLWSRVTSLQVAPPSVDMSTARPFV